MANSYDEKSIKILKGLEGCRARPTMYLGERGNSMVFQAFKELVDNAIDEYFAGRNKEITCYVGKNEYIVADKAEGIPIGINKEHGLSVLTLVFTHLHAGGKFDNKAYSVSCFTGNTKIKLADGKTKTMEWLMENYHACTFRVASCLSDGTIVSGKGWAPRITGYVDNLIKITLNNGKIEHCTPGHRWMLRNGEYKQAQDLKSGDSLMPFYHIQDKSGNWWNLNNSLKMKISAARKIKLKKKVPVYDISVEKHHNFTLESGVVVHNSGVHGLGAACTNAVSDIFEVWTFRNKWYYQKFKQGKPVTDVILQKPSEDVINKIGYRPNRGTIIRTVPDQSIVSVNSKPAVLDLNRTAKWLKDVALLNKRLKINVISGKTGKKISYYNEVGVKRLLEFKIDKLNSTPIDKPIIIEAKDFDLAVQWTDYDSDDGLLSYVNSSPTPDGGKHIDGFYSALSKVLSKYKKEKEKISVRDLKFGLIGILNYRMSGAEFSSQTKNKLTSNVPVEKELLPRLHDFFRKNQKMAKGIIKRAISIAQGREQFQQVMKNIGKIKKQSKGVLLPNILAVATNCKNENRELYVVEGNSAGGTAKQARDHNFQEVLNLSGKPINALKTQLPKLLGSEPVQNLLIAMGVDINNISHSAHINCSDLRVNNLYVLADADPDGPLIGDTRILTIDNTNPTLYELYEQWQKDKKPIWVYSRNTDGRIIASQAINPRVYVHTEKAIKITLQNDAEFISTRSHKWMLRNRFKTKREIIYMNHTYCPAEKLKVGDELFSNNYTGTIKRIESLNFNRPVPMYCMSVPETGNFLVYDGKGNGIASANSHISVLVLTIIYKLMPDLYKQGRVRVIDAPLFHAFYKNKHYFGSTFQDCYKQMPADAPKHFVIRAKGWGEINFDILSVVAFNPDTRSYIKLNPPKGADEKWFTAIVGEGSEARKKLLGL